MRVLLSALVLLGVLAQAGAAAAQSGMMPMMSLPPAQAHQQDIGPLTPMPTQRDRYLMKLSSLREKTLKAKAKDGGQLTPEHTAALQQELDRLNKSFGITAG